MLEDLQNATIFDIFLSVSHCLFKMNGLELPMSVYPDCFPAEFETDILPDAASCQDIEVFRVAKWGKVERRAFLSTHEEISSGEKPQPPGGLKLDDPGSYSTSCHCAHKDALRIVQMIMRHEPKARIMQGITAAQCGPSQITAERKICKDSHVDWWIYKNAAPQEHFTLMEDET